MPRLAGRTAASQILANRFFVGLAVVGLLSASDDDLHVGYVVDDAESLDRESAQAALEHSCEADSVPPARRDGAPGGCDGRPP